MVAGANRIASQFDSIVVGEKRRRAEPHFTNTIAHPR